MRKLLVASTMTFLFLLFLSGCASDAKQKNPQYVCSDGAVVSDPSLCVQVRQTQNEQSSDIQNLGEEPEESGGVHIEDQGGEVALEEEEQEKDGCSGADTETLRSLCYEQKYYEVALEANDLGVCNEIVMAPNLGLCYATVAYGRKNAQVCDIVKEIPYNATGYYDEITSREICFYQYVLSLETNYLDFESGYCSEIGNLQLKKECEEMDEEYYEYPESMELAAASKSGKTLSVQVIFNRDGYYYSYWDNSPDFQETSLNGELSYELKRRLEGGSISFLSDLVGCNDCKEDFESLLKSGDVDVSRSDFSRYEDADGNVILAYSFDIPLSGLQIDEKRECSGIAGEDYLECSISCLARQGEEKDGEYCQEQCEDEKDDLDCPMEYYLEIGVEGENGEHYDDTAIIPQILD